MKEEDGAEGDDDGISHLLILFPAAVFIIPSSHVCLSIAMSG